MCRSIKTLRRADEVTTTGELEAAARQYVRKISGYAQAVRPERRGVRWRRSPRSRAATARLVAALGVPIEEGPDKWKPRGAAAYPPRRRDATRTLERDRRPPGGSGRGSTSSTAGCGSPVRTPRRSRASTGRRCSSTTGHGSPRTRAAFQAALGRTGRPFRLRFALKANPLPEVLEVFRGLGAPGTPESVGIDACSPGEVDARAGVRLAARRDQLHRDQRVRARPRRAAGPRDPPQPRRDQPGRALRPAGAGHGASACASTRAPAPATTTTSSTPATGRPSSGSGWSGSTTRSPPPRGTTSRSTRSISTPGRAGWPTASTASSGRSPAAVEAVERLTAAGHRIGEVNVGGGLGAPARAGRASGRPRRLRGGPGAASRSARRDHRLRARRRAVEGRGDPAR